MIHKETRQRAVIPKHKAIKVGTLRSFLEQAGISKEDFQKARKRGK